jgi:predicted MFS family arabinose efflux permease
MGRLLLHTPVLRRRAFYHACLFASFSLFWTAAPLLLADRFHLSQNGIALFAAVGVAGVLAAPMAGRVADRGWTRAATGLAMVTVLLALLLGLLGASGSTVGLFALALTAVLLDLGVTANGVLGQRAIYALSPALRGRLNGLYMATFFAGGALGSAIGGWSYAKGGWALTVAFGLGLVLGGLACFATEPKEILS